MNKKIFLCLFLLCILCGLSFTMRGETVPGKDNWSLKRDQEGLSVCLDIPEGYYAYEESTMPEITPEVNPDRSPDVIRKKDDFSNDTIGIYKGGQVIFWHYPAAALPETFRVSVHWQFCRIGPDAACLLPGSAIITPADAGEKTEQSAKGQTPDHRDKIPSFRVIRSVSGYQSTDDLRSFLSGDHVTVLTDHGFLFSLLLAFLGGLALNLTPCVLPLIPVNLAMIGGKAGTKGKRIGRGILYGAGITVAYGILGCIAVLTGGTFGAIASSGYFNLFAAVIFLLLGLAMFDVMSFDLSRYSGKFHIPASAGYAGIFLMGALAAVLAGACVAPVITAALLQAAGMAAAGDYSGLLLPVLVGAGMGTPWPFAAAGISLFPKPGAWMNHVKHTLGILIFVLSLYYFWTGGQILISKFSAGEKGIVNGTETYDQIRQALEESGRTGKPVLLEFGASWCKTCKLMEHSVMNRTDIQDDLNKVILCKIAAEDPADPVMAPLLKQFNVNGLPTLVLIRPE